MATQNTASPVQQQWSYKVMLEDFTKAAASLKETPILYNCHGILRPYERSLDSFSSAPGTRMYAFFANRGQIIEKIKKLANPATIAKGLMIIYEYALQGVVKGYDGTNKQVVTIYDFGLPGYAKTQLGSAAIKIDPDGVLGLIYQLMAMESGFAVWQTADTDMDFCYGLGQYSADRFINVLKTAELAKHIAKIKDANAFGALGNWLNVFDGDQDLWEFWKFAGLNALTFSADKLYYDKYEANISLGLGSKFYEQVKSSLEELLKKKKQQTPAFDGKKSIEKFLDSVKNTSLAPNQVAYLFYLTVAVEAAVMVYEKVALIKQLLNDFGKSDYITSLQKGTNNNLIPLLVILSVGFNHVLQGLEQEWRDYVLTKAPIQKGNMATNWAAIKAKIPSNESNLKYVAAVIGAELFNYVFYTYEFNEKAKQNFEHWLGEKNTSNREYFITLLNTINDSGTDLGMLRMFDPSQKLNLNDLKKAIEILGASFSYMYKALEKGSFVYPFYADVVEEGDKKSSQKKRYVVLKDSKNKEVFRINMSTSTASISADLSVPTITQDEADTTTDRLAIQEALAKIKKENPELGKIMEELLNTITHPFELPQDKVGLAYKPLVDSNVKEGPVTVAEMHRGKIYTNNFDSDG
jgi:hypothetical protein